MKTFKTLHAKILILITITALALPVQSKSMTSDAAIPKTEIVTTDATASTKMIERLEEIKAMDKSKMTRVEKKTLRKEVKAIKKSLNASGNGVYLSVGAVIIIILLLILLL